MMREGGSGLIYFPLLNYANGNLDFLEEALDSDDCINSLSDGGAHCGTICDAVASGTAPRTAVASGTSLQWW